MISTRLLLKNEFAADDAMNRGEENDENDADKENEGEKVSVKQKTKDALTQRKKFCLKVWSPLCVCQNHQF